jgi:DNA polymerase III epsilon subunit-like protein
VDVDYYNLGHVADRLGIGRMGEHSALADAYAAYDVLTALIGRLAQVEGAPSTAP